MKLAKASVPYMLGAAAAFVAACAAWLLTGHPLALLLTAGGLLALLAFAYFFRDPERPRAADPKLVIAPADGRVMKIHRAGRTNVVEIFLAVWNVHVQRSPVSGKVVSRRYRRGAYLAAFNPLAGERNARCDTVLRCAAGTVATAQIAGAIARKVECWLNPGSEVRQGERMGIIHFGSQVRVTLPRGARILVKPGHVVAAGITPIAKWR